MIQLLIDTSYLAHRAHWTTRQLEFDDQPTGVLFGVFNTILDLAFDRRFLTNQISFFFDSAQSVRRDAFPEYKRKRFDNKTPEEIEASQIIKAQVKRLYREILPAIGFPCYRMRGLESDDLIAQAARQITWAGGKAVIITADTDLYQCINTNIEWHDPRKPMVVYNPLNFWAKYEIDPDQWGNVKSLAGCHSDNVPGIPGIGEARAIDYIMGGKLGARWKSAIESPEGREILNRNQQLVKLPHLATSILNLVNPAYNPDVFWQWCEKLGFKSYIDSGKARAWKLFFDGRVNEGVQIPRERKLV